MFSQQDLVNADGLSSAQRKFLEEVESNPDWLTRASFPGLWEPSPFFPAEICPWPMFARESLLAQIEQELAGLQGALSQCVLARAGDRASIDSAARERFAPHLDAVAASGVARGRILRADLLEERGGFRCLELNVTGSLGGDEVALIEQRLNDTPVYSRFLRRLAPAPTLLSCSREVFAAFEASRASRGGDVVVVADAGLDEAHVAKSEPLLRAFAAMWTGGSGEEYHLRRPEDLVVRGDRVHAARVERPVAAIVDIQFPIAELPQTLESMRASKTDAFCGPLGNLLSDKRCLAWITQDKYLGRLEPKVREAVESILPDTLQVLEGEATFEGNPVSMPEFLAQARERLVLKPADSLGGKGIVVGREASTSEWDESIRVALRARNFVVQRHVESVARPMQCGQHGWSYHAIVWGLFMLDGRLVGAYNRTMSRAKGDIVNVARGAESVLVYSVAE